MQTFFVIPPISVIFYRLSSAVEMLSYDTSSTLFLEVQHRILILESRIILYNLVRDVTFSRSWQKYNDMLNNNSTRSSNCQCVLIHTAYFVVKIACSSCEPITTGSSPIVLVTLLWLLNMFLFACRRDDV